MTYYSLEVGETGVDGGAIPEVKEYMRRSLEEEANELF